jgi:hypothetical protein
MTYFLRCDTRPKFAAIRRQFHVGASYRLNDHRHGSSTPIRQDKQMANTAFALLGTVTEPAVAEEAVIPKSVTGFSRSPSAGAASNE